MKKLLKKIKFRTARGVRLLLFKLADIILICPSFAENLIKLAKFCFNRSFFPANRIWSWKIVNSLYQRFPFELEKAFYKKGKKRVEDPLFLSQILPGEIINGRKEEYAGTFNIFFQFNAMVIEGFVTDKESISVDLILSGKKIRRLNCQSGGGYRMFKINLSRQVIETLPLKSELTIQTVESETNLLYKSSEKAIIELPHGQDTLFHLMENGSAITKKGQITDPEETVRERQNAYLALYTRVREFFESELQMPLFAMYGTLLGIYREGDFIKGDDDFDAGYIVSSTRPGDVKKETKEIVMKLIKAGFIVSFNRRGKLFRIQTEKGFDHKIHLDLRPVWFNSGNMWAHLQACIPGKREDFLPVQTVTLRGVDIDIPRVPEVLLEGYYGKGWKVPDPGYVNDLAKNQDFIIRTLNKTLLTPREYLAMKKNLAGLGNGEQEEQFVSTSYQPLYPLSEYCD